MLIELIKKVFKDGRENPVLAEDFNTMQDNIETSINAAAGFVASDTDKYNSTSTYNVGDLVIYDNKLYKCITEITTAEEFDSAKWQQTYLIDELGTSGGGENKEILYSNSTGTTGQNSLTLSGDYNNYTDLEITFDICMESGVKKYFGITQKVNIENSKSEIILGFMCSLPIYATFNLTNNTKLTITRNRICTAWNAPGEGNYLYITKIVGIR